MNLNLKLLFLSSILILKQSVWAQSPKTKEAREFVAQTMDQLKIKGLAYAVVKDGKIMDMQTFGIANYEWNLPVSEHTSFQIASSTKLLTSCIVLNSLKIGRLNLESPLSSYITNSPSAWAGIKIKHLISHTSGLKYLQSDPNIRVDSLVKLLKAEPLLYPPGTKQNYFSSDYMVLRYILESIYGKKFEVLMKEIVADPSGMKDGGYDNERNSSEWVETKIIREKAPTYYGEGDSLKNYKFRYAAYSYAAGGYFASITDMANWALALDQGKLFSKQLLYANMMQKEDFGIQNDFSKIGWIVYEEDGIKYAGHSGGPGLGDVLRFPDQGYTFIVLSNDGELYPGMARAIAGFYIDKLKKAPDLEKFKRVFNTSLNR